MKICHGIRKCPYYTKTNEWGMFRVMTENVLTEQGTKNEDVKIIILPQNVCFKCWGSYSVRMYAAAFHL